MNIGILHPGKMGVTIAQSINPSLHSLFWASDNRSNDTSSRAKKYNLIDLKNIKNILQNCDIVFISALNGGPVEIAKQICKDGYTGIVCDTNNLWGVESFKKMQMDYDSAGISYVEAGIFGWPVDHTGHDSNEHVLFLSGNDAEKVKSVLDNTYWDIRMVENSAKAEKEKYYLVK